MSEKDQKLVFFTVIFAILALGLYYGVRPALSSLAEIESQISDEEEQKSVNKIKVSTLPVLEMSQDEVGEKIKEKRKEFFDIMVSDQVDQMLTGMALSHKLQSYDMSIAMPGGPKQLSAYQYSELYKQLQREEEAVQTQEEEEDDSDSSSGTTLEDVDEVEQELEMPEESSSNSQNTDVYAVEVTMKVGGSDENLQAFLNELINSEKRIFIKSYSWGEVDSLDKKENTVIDNGDGTTTTIVQQSQIVVTKTLTVTIELYMCEQDTSEE